MCQDQKAEEIKELEQKLYIARSQIIDLSPDEFHALLRGYGYSFANFGVLLGWHYDTSNNISLAAVADPAMSNVYENRAACPLCRSRGHGLGIEGYKLPEGLFRHLHGEGNTRRCPVMENAFLILRDRHMAAFDKADQEEREAIANRKKTEPVLRFDPNQEPELFSVAGYNGVARAAEQLIAAEQDLISLGFIVEKTDNITAYKLISGDSHMLLADPRALGKINFSLFKRSGKKGWKSQPKYKNSFYLKDDWKDLPGKFQKRLQDLLNS